MPFLLGSLDCRLDWKGLIQLYPGYDVLLLLHNPGRPQTAQGFSPTPLL
jgi:hypothetical protein